MNFVGRCPGCRPGGASCPVCATLTPALLVKNQVYHQCPACDCVFTPAINGAILETENHGNALRHDQDQDVVRLKRLTQVIGQTPDRVIDFGCGMGETTRFLQSSGIEAIGIDQDTKIQLKDITDESVDGIMMVEVIEHLYQPREIFREFGRVLKPGGAAYVESSFADGKDLADWEYLDPAIGHCTTHSRRSVAKLGEENGFLVSWLNPNVFCFSKNRSGAAGSGRPQKEVVIVGQGLADPEVTLVVALQGGEQTVRQCLENLPRQKNFERCDVILVGSGLLENQSALRVGFFRPGFPMCGR